MKSSSDHKSVADQQNDVNLVLFLCSNLGSVLGLLKVGEKHLFVHDSHGQSHERTPLCLLDFYVHESKQRSGYGKRLFDAMLEVTEAKDPFLVRFISTFLLV